MVGNIPLVCLGQESWLHIPQGLAHPQAVTERGILERASTAE